jgi:dihydrodipicolinate synthase/N-acetylneuraminate lyase
MANQLGLVHAPVTPFKSDMSVDYDKFGRLIEYHLQNGADAIGILMTHAEDISLSDEEKRSLIETTVKLVRGRAPILVNVSDAGTAIAVDRARFAERAGVAAIASHPPYFWHPRAGMVVEHLVTIGTAVKLPFYLCSPVVEYPGMHLTTDTAVKVGERVPNLSGVIDACMDWVFMAEMMTNLAETQAQFQLMPGTDYMVQPGVLGAKGAVSGLSTIAPKLVRQVYELCASEKFIEARKPQEQLAWLYHVTKRDGLPGFKEVLRLVGRDCGDVRPPVRGLTSAQRAAIADEVSRMSFLKAEQQNW